IAASQLQKKGASLLASFEDTRAVGALAELLDAPDLEVRGDAMKGLTRLLPRLTSSDASLLSIEQRARIQSYLSPKHVLRYPEFILVILKAWIQVGDESAIPSVQALADAREGLIIPTPIRET